MTAVEAGCGQDGSLPTTWAAVPFKGPVGSKRRLSGVLTPAERGQHGLAMLDDVLDALFGSGVVETVLLLTQQDGSGLDRPAHERIVVLADGTGGGPVGLNGAIVAAQAQARAAGADRLLILPADLPLLSAADVCALVDASRRADVAIAPDRQRGGTNALLLRPPDGLVPGFGEMSFARHRDRARAAGLSLAVVQRPGLALDLDTPDDLRCVLAAGAAGRARRLLRTLGVEARLDRPAEAQARSATS